MKRIQLVFLSLAALLHGRPQGYCTANAEAAAQSDVTALQERLDAQEAELKALREQLAAKEVKPAVEETGTLALLCKGAGVSIEDVRWRVQNGLDPEQAVSAALAQKAHDERKAVEAEARKAEEAKAGKRNK